MNPRLLIWVQHLLGVGHLARAGAIADACAELGFEVALASGGFPAKQVLPRRARLVQLTPLKAADESFSALADRAGAAPGEALLAERRDALLSLFGEFAPQIVMTESFPFGRRRFAFELEPLLRHARMGKNRPLIVSSVRDILVPFVKPRHEQEAIARLDEFFDAVLVHGDPALVALDASAPWIASIAPPLHYTGYVVRDAQAAPTDDGGEILVSAGGGAVGASLFRAALEAAALTPEFSWRIVGGPSLDGATLGELSKAASGRLVVEGARDDLALLMASARVCVMQAGYNSVAEGLAARARMILVPWQTPRETEQRDRARLLAASGLASMLEQERLSGAALAQEVRQSTAKPRPRPQIALDGARQTGKILLKLLGSHGRK